MRRAIAALAAACLALAWGGEASAQASAKQSQVRGYLTAQAGKHRDAGFAPASGVADFSAMIALRGGVIWPVRLRAGMTYRVFAVCDNDCADVDLDLYDPQGRYIGQDVAVNDKPYVEVTPPRDGEYFARLWLVVCENEPCAVGGRVYARPAQ